MSRLFASFQFGSPRSLDSRVNGPRRPSGCGVGAVFSLAIVGLFVGGCGSTTWFRNGFLDPTQVGQFKEPRHNGIRRTLSILEEPEGIPTAEEPRPEDLVPDYAEMPIGPGDTISITVLELLFPGQTTEITTRVGNAGRVTLPELGPMQVAGLGARELEMSIVEALREKQVLEDADVRVTVIQSQTSRFSVVGQVNAPGMYPITHPDFRVLDAVAAMGGVSPQIEKIYVFRRTEADGTGGEEAPELGEPGALPGGVEEIEQEPMTYLMSDFSVASTPGGGLGMADVHDALGQYDDPPIGASPEEEEPVPVFDPESGEWSFDKEKSVWEAPPAEESAGDSGVSEFAKPISDVEAGQEGLPEGVGEPVEAEPEAEDAGMTKPEAKVLEVEWDANQAPEPPVRIIAIPVKELLDGNPQYNIVIRPSDTINVMGTIGEYYMMGNIARSGAYSITGRRITVKEAVAAAGGFGALAWPARADLIRRVSQDEEQIIQLDLDAVFAGNAPDFYLRPNDILNVGTSPVSVFLAVLRNSFRFSYGVGLVYDRNFADSDSFVAREQVKTRRAAEAARRGIPAS